MPALAACLLLAVALIGLWALSLRRENQSLAQRRGEATPASGQAQSLEARIRELEASDSASQEQKESLKQEISRLKEQLAATERQRETQVASSVSLISMCRLETSILSASGAVGPGG